MEKSIEGKADTFVPPVWTLFSARQRWTYLAILFLVSLSNYADRHVMSVLLEPIKIEFQASDTMMGLLTGLSFALLYATLGLPIARIADFGNRKKVISISLTVWSVMTVLCGFAQNFWQLALARVGVGAGEAGGLPPSQSLIADYFPPERRASALSIFLASASLGYLVAFIGATQIAAAYGWRWAFIMLGLPGLLIVLLTHFVLREPRLNPVYAITDRQRESVMDTLRALAARKSFTNLLIAMVFYFLFAYGVAVFFPSYMMRVLGVSLEVVGAQFGVVSIISSLAGTVLGGILADRLGARDQRWLVWLPALGLSVTVPAVILGLAMTDFTLYLAINLVSGIFLGATVPAMFAALHLVCGETRRAQAVALVFFFSNLIGMGLGPVITGALSDGFSAAHGAEGLRYALMIATLFLLPAVVYLLMAARTLLEDHRLAEGASDAA